MDTPAGWYPDPDVPGGQRWWDGANWSDDRVAPAPPAPPAPSASAGPVFDAPPPTAAGVPGGGYVAAPAQPKLNTLAVVSLVLAILWLFGIGSLLAVILGIVARRQITQRQERGNGIAVSGIVIGVLGLLATAAIGAGIAFFVSNFDTADLTLIAGLQETHRNEQGTYASSIAELEDTLGSDFPLLDDVTIVTADQDSYCAELRRDDQVHHIRDGSFVASEGPC